MSKQELEKDQTLAMVDDTSEQDEQKENSPYSIVIDHVYKSYGHGSKKKDVLIDLNLQVLKGEIFGYIGKNGIGKSTTIDCIVGLKEQDSGNIYINGVNTLENPLEAKDLFGYVPSEPIAYEMMTGNEFLQFMASSYGMIDRAFTNNYNYLVNKFDMSEVDMNRKIKEYSHGMKQKVCLMASLIHNPKIWILDEPTVGLDPMVYQTLVSMIKEFAKGERTVFITSHNIDLVDKICDRVAILNNGKVARLYDLNADPIKRRDLSKIFFRIYEDDKEKEKAKLVEGK